MVKCSLKDIKILECVFKNSAEVYENMIYPVSAGAELYNKNDIVLSMRDDTGENISKKNPFYCELTVQYWAWKNLKCDVCGIFHQRRFLDFSMKNKKYPYSITEKSDEKTFDGCCRDDYACVCEANGKYRALQYDFSSWCCG